MALLDGRRLALPGLGNHPPDNVVQHGFAGRCYVLTPAHWRRLAFLAGRADPELPLRARTLPVAIVGQKIDHIRACRGLAGDKIPTNVIRWRDKPSIRRRRRFG